MYVEDVTDVQELLALRAEVLGERAETLLKGGRYIEQIDWDLEDIEERLWELGGE